MYLKASNANPLIPIFDLLDKRGEIMLTSTTLKILNDMFCLGGVFAESQHELVDLLRTFSEWYGLTEIVKVDNIHYFRKVNG